MSAGLFYHHVLEAFVRKTIVPSKFQVCENRSAQTHLNVTGLTQPSNKGNQ